MKTATAPQGWTFLAPVGQDASTRRYSRIEKNGRTAIFMDCSLGETPGHRLQDYIRIGDWLRDAGLKTPEIYESGNHYLIIEDFGDISFKKALPAEGAEKLYALAADVLRHLEKQKALPELPGYVHSNVDRGHRRVVDWYAPLIRQKKNEQDLLEEYQAVWKLITKDMPALENSFLHIDFHAENLMYLPREQGLKQCGILDFQGAMRGPAPYDWANLFEDVRIDVTDSIREKNFAPRSREFQDWYRILGTQFHCRVIGQFIKLAAREHKTGYLQYIPRTQGYIRKALDQPVLQPLKKFFIKHEIDFDQAPDLRNIKALVAPDAF